MTTTAFPDHFSGHATEYVKFRPLYPIELAEYLAHLVQTPHAVAWDCGCGNGQLAILLADYFQRVIATDASAAQIHHAISHPQIDYKCSAAEQSCLENESVDLIVVAQAAHWFNLPKFYEEVQRVAKPQAIIALITYNLMHINSQLDEIIEDFYQNILGTYWSPERRHVENNYAKLFFPFEKLPSPNLNISAELPLEGVINYINTWSAIRPAKQQLGLLPFETFENKLKENWGDLTTKKIIRWQLTLLVGKVK
jgi:SAM-dependent methyltransferase